MPKSNVETWLALTADFAEAELTDDIARNLRTLLSAGGSPLAARVLRGNMLLTITVTKAPPEAA